MKYLILCLCFFIFAESDCNEAKTEKRVQTPSASASNINMSEDNYENQIDGISYEFKIRLIKKGTVENGVTYQEDTLSINYELENQSDLDYLVFNRGHAGKDDGKPVYVEPQADNTVQLSQKAFVQPKDKRCRARIVNVVPRASLLKAKQTTADRTNLVLPLRLQTPYDDCTPQLAMPAAIANTKFCLGVAPVKSAKIKVDAIGNVLGWKAFNEQKLLCSELIQLQ